MRAYRYWMAWLFSGLMTVSSSGLEVFRPKIGVPEFTQPGSTFRVEVLAPAGLSSNGWSVVLANDLRAWSNSVVEQVSYGPYVYNNSLTGYRLLVRSPSDAPPEVFSLEVRHVSAGAATNRHAVSLVPSLESDFYLLHYADPQVSGSNALYASGMNSPNGSVQEIYWHASVFSLMNPRFLFDTGDEVNDGDVDTVNRYAQYLNAINTMGPPLLITRGNNDRGDFGHWKTNLGQAAYSMKMGSFYIGMNDTRGNEMYSWMTNDYATSFADTNIRYRLIGQHFNSNGDGKNVYFFTPSVGQYPNLMLVGHVHVFSTIQSSPYAVLSSGPAYNYGAVSLLPFHKNGTNWLCPGATNHPAGTRFDVVGDWGAPKVTCAYGFANDGMAYTNTAIITNSLSFRFWDGRIRFLMHHAARGYIVNGGSVLAQYDYAGGSNTAVLVQVDIRPNALTTLSIARVDSDEDDIPDAWELSWFGDLVTATNNTDFDLDAVLDRQEYVAGTNPKDSTSWLKTGSLCFSPLQELLLRWSSVTGKYYDVLANAQVDLDSGTAASVSSNVYATPPENTFTTAVDQSEFKFYWIRTRE
jgi:hypothetical protein